MLQVFATHNYNYDYDCDDYDDTCDEYDDDCDEYDDVVFHMSCKIGKEAADQICHLDS